MNENTMKEVRDVTRKSIILTLVIGIILALFSLLDKAMLTGLIFGCIFAILNFRLLAVSLQKALSLSPAKAQIYASSRYIIRMTLTAVVILVSVKASHINLIGVVIGLLSPKFVILGSSLPFNKLKRKEA